MKCAKLNTFQFLFLFCFLLLHVQCGNPNRIEQQGRSLINEKRDARGNLLMQQFALDDTVDFEIIYYYPNGHVKRAFHAKDSLQHGLDREYFMNANLKLEGNWFKGKKTGDFKYYDSTGKLATIRKYIVFRDTDICKNE